MFWTFLVLLEGVSEGKWEGVEISKKWIRRSDQFLKKHTICRGDGVFSFYFTHY